MRRMSSWRGDGMPWLLILVWIAAFVLASSAEAQRPEPRDVPNLKIKVAGVVSVTARLPDGSVLVGGDFTSINGTPRENLARIDADGQFDAGWMPQVDGPVTAIAIGPEPASPVYIGGGFTTAGTLPRGGLAKLDGDSGQVDAAWSAPEMTNIAALAADASGVFVAGTPTDDPGARLIKLDAGTGARDSSWNVGGGPNDTVQALLRLGDWLYLGGDFTQVGSASLQRLARIGADDGVADSDWRPQADGSVLALAGTPEDGLFVGGAFTRIAGVFRFALAKIDPQSATIDVDWASDDPNGAVWSIAVGAGEIVVAGPFAFFGSERRRGIAKLDSSDGSTLAGWQPDFATDFELIKSASYLGTQGDVLAGGTFSEVGSDTRLALARISNTGAVGPRLDAERSGRVDAMVFQGEKLVLGGKFLTVEGYPRRNLVRLLADGSVDPQWVADADGGFDGAPVRTLAVDRDDRLYVGGEVEYVNGEFVSGLARLDSETGRLDGTWTPVLDGPVNVLEFDRQNRLYVGGAFPAVDGIARGGAARFDAQGNLDSWDPRPQLAVTAIAFDAAPEQNAYLAGTNDFGIGRISRFLASGETDPNWLETTVAQRELQPAWLSELEVGSDGSVFVGGRFATVNDEPRFGLAKLSPRGELIASWTPATQLNTAIEALLLGPDGMLFVGGTFGSMQGRIRIGLAGVDQSDGEVSSTWRPQVNGFVKQIVPMPSGDVLVGGQFGFSAAHVRDGVFAFPAAAPPGVVLAPEVLPDPVVDVPYDQTLSATGGIEPYTFAVDGLLPDGLMLDPTTGNISGTPVAAGTWSFRVEVADGTPPIEGGPLTAEQTYVLTARGSQSIAFGANPGPTHLFTSGVRSIANSSSGLPVVFDSDSPEICLLHPETGEIFTFAVGDCVVTANQPGDDVTLPAAEAVQVVPIIRALQAALTLQLQPASVDVGQSSELQVTGGSGSGAVRFEVAQGQEVCSLSNTAVTALSAGTCTLRATKAGDASYEAASASATLTVGAAPGGNDVFRNGFEGVPLMRR